MTTVPSNKVLKDAMSLFVSRAQVALNVLAEAATEGRWTEVYVASCDISVGMDTICDLLADIRPHVVEVLVACRALGVDPTQTHREAMREADPDLMAQLDRLEGGIFNAL